MEADRKLRMSETVFDGPTFRGIVLPPLMSTKICMLSAGNDLAEVADVADDDRERMMKESQKSV